MAFFHNAFFLVLASMAVTFAAPLMQEWHEVLALPDLTWNSFSRRQKAFCHEKRAVLSKNFCTPCKLLEKPPPLEFGYSRELFSHSTKCQNCSAVNLKLQKYFDEQIRIAELHTSKKMVTNSTPVRHLADKILQKGRKPYNQPTLEFRGNIWSIGIKSGAVKLFLLSFYPYSGNYVNSGGNGNNWVRQ